MITHYCLLDNDSSAHKVGVSLNQQQTGVAPSAGGGASLGGSATGVPQSSEILTNLLHVFMSHSDAKNAIAMAAASSSSSSGGGGSDNRTDVIAAARAKLLHSLPRLVSCVATLWAATRGSSSLAGRDACLLKKIRL